MSNQTLTIICLTKNNFEELCLTSYSIINQNLKSKIEWLIIDGSTNNKIKKNTIFLKEIESKKSSNIEISHICTNNLKINGIYPCMNYGLKIAKGKSIIFLNSGDRFYNSNSLKLMDQRLEELNVTYGFVFGQAKIIYSNNLSWEFPGKRINNINRWLSIFDPNHQSMLITKKLAKKIIFDESCAIISDGIWKRKIINNAESFDFIREPVINFHLNGVSNMKPKLKTVINNIRNKKVTLIRKIIIIIKLLVPNRIYNFYPFLQRFKSLLIDFIF